MAALNVVTISVKMVSAGRSGRRIAGECLGSVENDNFDFTAGGVSQFHCLCSGAGLDSAAQSDRNIK